MKSSEQSSMKAKEKENVMNQYGITCETKYVYHYKNHRYDDLQQAINYAHFDQRKSDSKDQSQ